MWKGRPGFNIQAGPVNSRLPAGLFTAITAALLAEAAAAAEAAVRLGTRFVDGQRPAADFLAVQNGHGIRGLTVIAHFHEAEAAGAAGFTIGHDADPIDGAVGLE